MAHLTDNYKKHTVRASFWQLQFLQRFLINNFFTVLLSEVKKLHPDSILDVGCGEGFSLQRLQEAGIGKTYEGVDSLPAALALGKKIHPKLHLKQGDIYHLPYEANTFDVVLCTEVLEHLTEPAKALKELKRVSKGYCVISVPNEPWFMVGNFLRGKNIRRFGNDIEHIQHWSTGSIKKFIDKEMTVVTVQTPMPWTMVIAKK